MWQKRLSHSRFNDLPVEPNQKEALVTGSDYGFFLFLETASLPSVSGARSCLLLTCVIAQEGLFGEDLVPQLGQIDFCFLQSHCSREKWERAREAVLTFALADRERTGLPGRLHSGGMCGDDLFSARILVVLTPKMPGSTTGSTLHLAEASGKANQSGQSSLPGDLR